MKCPYCSKEILDGAIWCRFCKNHLDDETTASVSGGAGRGGAAPPGPARPWPGGAGVAPGSGDSDSSVAKRHPGSSAGHSPYAGGADADFNRWQPTEVDEQRAEKKRAALAEMRMRMAEVQALMEKGKNQAAANEAVAAREYFHSLTVEDIEIDAEAESLRQKIALLEEMGYKGVDPDYPHGRPRFVLPRITLGKAVAVILVCLAIWGAYTMHRVTSETALRQPGGIGGTLMILAGEDGSVLQPLPFHGILLYNADSDMEVQQSRLARIRDPRAAWKFLTTRKGFPKTVATARTDNVGNFKFEQVPPGDYFVVTCTPHEENPLGWFVAARVSPLKLTKVALRVENTVARKK